MGERTLDEHVEAAVCHFRGYIDGLLEQFEKRQDARRNNGIKVVNFVGHGRCGKDTSAAHFSTLTGAAYGGATSSIVNPMIAWCLGIDEERSFATRHDNRMYWFDWCNAFRRKDPSLLCRMLLGQGDICAGTRSHAELTASLNEKVLDVVVWINKVDTGIDPTMEYDAGDIVNLPFENWSWIDNNKEVSDLYKQVHRLAVSLDMIKGV